MPTKVDPFIPVPAKKSTLPQGQYGTQWLRKPTVSTADVKPIAKPAQPLRQPSAAPKPQVATLAPSISRRTLDGFVSAPPRPVKPAVPSAHHDAPQPHRAPQLIDAVRPSAHRPDAPHHPPRQAPTIPHAARPHAPVKPAHRPLPESVPLQHAAPPSPLPSLKPTAKRFSLHVPQKLQIPLIVVSAICIGLAIPLLIFGEIAIAAYAVIALVRRIPSRTSFLLALIALGAVVVLLLLQGQGSLSQNFAVYAFLLLTVGTISLALEVRRQATQGHNSRI